MITIEHLQKKFGNLGVLDDLNATIRKGDVISIIGPSGCGKSTFLRCLNLLEKPTGGSIRINGEDILDKRADANKLRRKMGMVFQSFNLFDHLTILENLTIGQIKLLRRTPGQAQERGMELLKLVGMADKAQVYPDQLSGGQKQRAAIARCLSMDPEIILFDEPTSALDPTMVGEVLGVMKTLARQGMTMVIVTHEMDFARDVCTRVFYMDEKGIYEEGSPTQIFENPAREKTRIFINRIRSFNYRIENDRYDLYELKAQLEVFCNRLFLPLGIRNNIALVLEEYLTLIPVCAAVEIWVEYSEKTHTVTGRIFRQGETAPLLQAEYADELSLSILQGLCSQLCEQVAEGGVELKFQL